MIATTSRPILTKEELELSASSSRGYVFPTTGKGGSPILFGSYPIPTKGTESRDTIVANLIQEGYWVKATGSRVTKDGWTSESDWDYVVYDPDNTLNIKLVEDSSWTLDGSGNGVIGIDFYSFKQGNVNLILTNKDSVWKKYIIATNLLRMLNPKTKKERIALFDSVFGKDVDSKAVEF